MTTKEKIEEILNKKFKQSIFSGYDTLDVDEFFDDVIEYLKLNDKNVEEYRDIANKLKIENEKLLKIVEQQKEDIANKDTLLAEYEANGYKSVVKNSHIQNERKNKEGN